MTALDPSPATSKTTVPQPVSITSEALGATPGPRLKSRTQAQKERRKALWLARADERRNVERLAILARYEDLKRAMARVGLRIGTIKDIDAKLDDPVERFEVLKARVERWDALWSITQRKRETRGKIIIGGAVLAALADLVDDAREGDETRAEDPHGHRAWLFALLDERVLRVRDRGVVRELLMSADGHTPPLPLRPGGPMNESIEDALTAVGEGLSPFEQRAVGGGSYDHDSSEEADMAGFLNP
jgi:hypothetical protein